jgi:uncharacterized protein YjbJ (UPF0337 family)
MDEKIEDLKGRAKEAVGDLADDPHLKREGQIDRAAAKIKEIVEEAKTRVDDAIEKLNVDRARDRTKEILEEMKTKIDGAIDALKARLRSGE